MTETNQPELHTRYPIMSILTYNGATIVHYFLGSWGILIGYNFTTAAINISAVYFLFSFIQMHVLMPLMVGPTCVYYRTDGPLNAS